MNCTNLYAEFKEWYSNTKRPFLLLDMVNVKENGHTNILKSILEYQNDKYEYIFLRSFLEEVIGMRVGKMTDVTVTTQKAAQGLNKNGNGFMDLYVEFKNDGMLHHVIVENKINDACDTPHQLDRYVYSIMTPGMDFDKWIGDPEMHCAYGDEYANIHLLYLTKDGTKMPTAESFTDTLKKNMGDSFLPVSYANDILPWLKHTVLPQCPYGKDGMTITGIRQYIAYLEYLVMDAAVVWKPFSEIRKDFKETDDKLYAALSDVQVDGVDDNDVSLIAFKKQMEMFRREIFDDSDLLPSDWEIYVTPSFLCLYKQSWRDIDDKDYAAPSLALVTGNADKYRSGKGQKVKWVFSLSHLPKCSDAILASDRTVCKLCREIETLDNYKDNIVFVNHNININFGSSHTVDFDFDINNKTERVQYLNSLIKNIEADVSVIDNAIKRVADKA